MSDQIFTSTDEDQYTVTVRHYHDEWDGLNIQVANPDGDFMICDLSRKSVRELRDALNEWLGE